MLIVFAIALTGCASQATPSARPEAPTPFPEQGTEEQPGGAASLVPSPEASPRDVYVSERGGWSIVVPDGWELLPGPDQVGASLSRDQAIAEILVSPGRGLTIEDLQEDQVQFLSSWPGAHDVESQIVSLPVGAAVRGSLETTDPSAGPYVFISHLIERGEWLYGISVRGPKDAGDLHAAANALAESFAISRAPVPIDPQPACVASETTPIGPNRIPAWGREPLYLIGALAGPNPGPRSVTLVFFRVAGSDEEFTLAGEDAMTGDPIRFAHMHAGERRGELRETLQLTDATAEDASEMGRGWITWMVAVELNEPPGCYTLRAEPEGLFGDEIEFTIPIG